MTAPTCSACAFDRNSPRREPLAVHAEHGLGADPGGIAASGPPLRSAGSNHRLLFLHGTASCRELLLAQRVPKRGKRDAAGTLSFGVLLQFCDARIGTGGETRSGVDASRGHPRLPDATEFR